MVIIFYCALLAKILSPDIDNSNIVLINIPVSKDGQNIGEDTPDSGSFSVDLLQYEFAAEAATHLTKSQHRSRRRRTRPQSHSEAVFSPSPLGRSPISLMGGYMGMSVPTTMNNIMENAILDEVIHRGGSALAVGERQPLLSDKNASRTTASEAPRIVVTAIVENANQLRQKHPSGTYS